jgi:thioesterase domain-containing protein
MTTAQFLASLRESDVRLVVEDGKLKVDAPAGVLDDAMREELKRRKADLIATLAAAQTTLAAPLSVVPLKPTGDRPALFARPGHNGDVFCYRSLATYLNPRQPLYGIEPQGSDGSPLAGTVEEMAAYECAQIRSTQPHGPYHVAGYCAGGAVAYESARQLVAAGEEVALVVLFAAPFPLVYRPVAQLKLTVRSLGERIARHTAAVTSGSLPESVAYLRNQARNRQEERAHEEEREHDPALANRRRVEDGTMTAMKRYTPGPYAGRIEHFLPSDGWRHLGDRPDDWKGLAPQLVEHVLQSGADGDNLLREPHVRGLAAQLEPVLRGGRS